MEYAIQAEAFSLLQRRRYNEAVDFLDKHNLFQQSVIDFEILKLFNNYLISCFHTQQFERGISVFENIQDVAPLNPHIYHNAACLYCKMKMSEKAIAQIQLARKYGGMTLISLLKSDADLDVISAHPDFIQAVLPVNRKFTPGIITIPFEGVNHFQFDELTQNEMVSMFFIFKVCFSDLRKEVIRSMISTITSKEDWSDGLVDYTGSFRGWRDRTFIGSDFMTIHIKNVRQPKPLMQEIEGFAQSLDEELIEFFFVKRELDSRYFGTTALSLTESSLAAIFAATHSEVEFWQSSFSYTTPYPSPEYTGELKVYGHHDGSVAAELRALVYDPHFRISYGLVKVKVIEDNERASAIFEFVQNELSKYFYNEVPVIMNTMGEQKLDCITAFDRIGYAFEITNNEILDFFYTRYAFRVKEAKLFKVVKDAIARFKLSHVIHWYRDRVYVFHIWERSSG